MTFSNLDLFLRRWPLLSLGALCIVLVAAAAVISSGAGPAGADDGQKVPARPTGLQVAPAQGSLDVAVDWDDVDGATSYLVRWRVAGPGNELNEGVTPGSSSADITVADFGEWVVRVEACNDAGCGDHAALKFSVEPLPD